MDSLQGRDCNLGIDLRRLDIGVTKDLLDDPDVGSVLVHQRRHRVTKKMACSGLAQLCVCDVFARDPSQLIAADLPSLYR